MIGQKPGGALNLAGLHCRPGIIRHAQEEA
jgi:hypothetical protein